jgi:hypothetical protein
MRDYNHPAYRTCHLGTSGIGKNTDFLPRLMRESKKARWVFIFDHKREFSQKIKIPVVQNLAQLVAATARGGFILFDHQMMFPGDRQAGFRFFCTFIYEASKDLRGRKILVADELQEVAGPVDDCTEIITCLDDGRSLKIDAMLIAQSANGLHTRIRNQLTELFVFRQSDENAIRHLKQNGFDENAVRALRPGEWFWKNLNTGATARGGKAFTPHSARMPDGGTAM